ncbi:GNAT family N-acetyltransferase [Glycocaulis profundi]|nr:GNAT family N-acetyltransferase [Glycocaulis profundi]
MSLRIETAGPEAAGLLAALHPAMFDDPWNEGAFKALLSSLGVTALIASRDGVAEGFVLYRAVADEAEVLTFGIAPDGRRAGTGRALLAAMEDRAEAAGAQRLFLEVSERNAAAIALYEGAGWTVCGGRKGYYADGADARLLEKRLAKPPPYGSD